MKKQKMQMLLLLLLLVLFVAAFVGLRVYNDAQANKPAEVEGKVIIDMEYADTELFSYTYEGETYSFERIDDVWYVAGDQSQNVQQVRIKAMLSAVAPFVAEQVIENVTDFGQYGLEEPQKTIIFGDDMEQYTLEVGDKNSVSNTYYVRVNDGTDVYVVELTTITRFNTAIEDIVEVAEETTEASDEAVEGSAEESTAATE